MNYSQDAKSRKRNSNKRKRKKAKSGIGVILLRIIVAIVVVACFALCGAFIGAYTGIIDNAPALSSVDATPESYTSLIYDSEGNEIDTLHGEENRQYVKLSLIPQDLQDAVVAIEDQRFYDHNGVDIKGMFRALYVNIKEKNMSQGASTITQQLMKNEVLTSEKKLSRKLQEQYLSVSYEKLLTEKLGSKEKAKNYILELYLNTISLHHGLNGVGAASKFYFGKEVNELTLAQCASIAGITKNPSAYSPLSKPEKNRERTVTVLKKMLELGYITQEEYDEAYAEDISASIVGLKEENQNKTAYHNYFVDSVIVELADQLMEEKNLSKQQAYNLIYSGGLKIYTTVDTNMQNIMEESFKKDELYPPNANTLTASYTISVMDNDTGEDINVYREKIVANQEEADAFAQSVKDEVLADGTKTMLLDKLDVAKSLQAAMVIMDHSNGHVKALVGGRDKDGDLVFNRATHALRQPGSCFKVLAAYAPAIDNNIVMPGTGIVDEPYEYEGWSPKNWYGEDEYRGMCTVREGVYDSLNILAAKVIVMTGVDTALDYLENFGFTTLKRTPDENGNTDTGPAISLGGVTDGVSVLELTAAYSAIANQGEYIKPVFYTKVLDHDGNVIIDNTTPETHRVIKETTAYLLTDMMKDVHTVGTGGLARFTNIQMNQAGKTGTTTDDKDLVFAGFTPYYCAGIWMGYDNPKRIVYDKSYHLLLWKDVMEQIHQGLENKEFEKPEGIVSNVVCSASNKTPDKLCVEDYYGTPITADLSTEDFVNHKDTCTLHSEYLVCAETGMLPHEGCPTERVVVATEIDKDGKIKVINLPTLQEGQEYPVDEEGNKLLMINLNETCSGSHPGLSGPSIFYPSDEVIEGIGGILYNRFGEILNWDEVKHLFEGGNIPTEEDANSGGIFGNNTYEDEITTLPGVSDE